MPLRSRYYNRNRHNRHHTSSRPMFCLTNRTSRCCFLGKSYICYQSTHRRQTNSPILVLPCSTPFNSSSSPRRPVSTRYHPQRICPLLFVTRQHIVRPACRSIFHPPNRRIHLESHNFSMVRYDSKTFLCRPRATFSTRHHLLGILPILLLSS